MFIQDILCINYHFIYAVSYAAIPASWVTTGPGSDVSWSTKDVIGRSDDGFTYANLPELFESH